MRIGLALSGGGIRGTAHIGALKAFEENNMEIDIIAGTSAGSIVATLYAMNYTPDEIIETFRTSAKSVMGIGPKYLYENMRENKSIKVQGLISGHGIETLMQKKAEEKGLKIMADINMPIAVPATDLIECKKVVFTNLNTQKKDYVREIEIGKAVRASSSFPGVYTPVDYRQYQLVDGGVVDNLPSDEVKKMGADKIISIKFDVKHKKKHNTLYNIGMQSLDIMSDNLIEDAMKVSDVVLNIDLREVKVFNTEKLDFCYEQGYEQTKKQMPEIKKKLGIGG